MAMFHAFTSGKSASPDATLVDGPNWDADHVISGGNLGALLYQGTAGAPTLINSVASGQVLVSAGAGSVPAWSAAPSVTTLVVTEASSGSANTIQLPGTQAGNGIVVGGDTNLYRSSANLWRSDDSMRIDGGLGVGATAPAAGMIGMTEQTAPSAPAANGVILYAVDNGSGKTQLMALFSSGAAQQIAIQP